MWIDGLAYQVDEISERAVRVVLGSNQFLPEFEKGSIQWSDRRTTFFTGNLGPFRGRSRRLIINIREFGMNDIIKEQRRLLAKYPMMRSQG